MGFMKIKEIKTGSSTNIKIIKIKNNRPTSIKSKNKYKMVLSPPPLLAWVCWQYQQEIWKTELLLIPHRLFLFLTFYRTLKKGIADLWLIARNRCGWPPFLCFLMVWMIFPAIVKLYCDLLFFILKGGKSEFWPLCFPSAASPGRNIFRVTSASLLPCKGTWQFFSNIFMELFSNKHPLPKDNFKNLNI